MTDDFACPPWCQQSAGHLHVETDGPGDYHTAEIALIDLPEIPGLRGETAFAVRVEQYVTAGAVYQPVISLGLGGAGEPDDDAFTLDEADILASAISRAVTAVRNARTGRDQDDDAQG
ncbi:MULTISPECIES: DUF6907 domain-containing protein [Frankia]|uniref:DUF6907 domain-containing protein n=1 Tax=Frankia TaxID=1854 RepID=UPI002118464F|nr:MULTISPECIES: hypothetical protein [Frankia]